MHDRTILAAIVVRRLGFNHRRAWIDGYSLEPICLPALPPHPSLPSLPPAASPRPGPWTSPQIVRGEDSHARSIPARNHLPTRVHRMHVHVTCDYAPGLILHQDELLPRLFLGAPLPDPKPPRLTMKPCCPHLQVVAACSMNPPGSKTMRPSALFLVFLFPHPTHDWHHRQLVRPPW